MGENKYYCPECGAEMYEKYEKPALNLICPKCGCKLATTKWEKIDLDETEYEVIITSDTNPNMDQIKAISRISGKNFIFAKNVIVNGGMVFKGRASEVKKIISLLETNSLKYDIVPKFPY